MREKQGKDRTVYSLRRCFAFFVCLVGFFATDHITILIILC